MAKSKVIPVRFNAIELSWLDLGVKTLNMDSRSDLIRVAFKEYLKDRGINVSDVPELTLKTKKEPSTNLGVMRNPNQ